jgi:hypothetical protein
MKRLIVIAVLLMLGGCFYGGYGGYGDGPRNTPAGNSPRNPGTGQ